MEGRKEINKKGSEERGRKEGRGEVRERKKKEK